MKTPPPRRQQGLKLNTEARNAEWRRLKQEFDAAHQQGMDGLQRRDYAAVETAITREHVVLKKWGALAKQAIRDLKPKARKRKATKKR